MQTSFAGNYCVDKYGNGVQGWLDGTRAESAESAEDEESERLRCDVERTGPSFNEMIIGTHEIYFPYVALGGLI